jgi:hypothetical protein
MKRTGKCVGWVLFVIAVLKAPFDAFDTVKRIFSLVNDARVTVKWVAAVVATVVTASVSPPTSTPPESFPYKIANASHANVILPTMVMVRAAPNLVVVCGRYGACVVSGR